MSIHIHQSFLDKLLESQGADIVRKTENGDFMAQYNAIEVYKGAGTLTVAFCLGDQLVVETPFRSIPDGGTLRLEGLKGEVRISLQQE